MISDYLRVKRYLGNSEQEGTSAKTRFFFIQKTVFLGTFTTFSRVNRNVSAYFCVGIQNKKLMHI